MSKTLDLFKAALGLAEPWRVTRSDLDVVQGRPDLYLDFPRGARFGCSVAGCEQGSCPVHDTEAKTWRQMDFFQYKAFCTPGCRISNGLLEGTNSLIQAAKARARGYRGKTKMITIIYLIAGKLPNPSPCVAHPI